MVGAGGTWSNSILYVGAGGASAVYHAIGTNMTVAQAIVAAGHDDPTPSNPELATIKAKDFEKILEGRLVNRGGMNSPHASAANEGDRLNSSSSKNGDLKQGTKPIVIQDNSTNVYKSGGGGKTTTIQQGTNMDFPLYMD